MNNYLLKENKLDLILNTNTRDDSYKLKFSINKYLYTLKRISSAYNMNSLLYKIRLFLPGRLLKVQPNIKFKYSTTFVNGLQVLISKEISLLEDTYSKREINELIEKGKELEKDLDYLINQSKNQIMKIKTSKQIENANNIIKKLQEYSLNQDIKSNEIVKKENIIIKK